MDRIDLKLAKQQVCCDLGAIDCTVAKCFSQSNVVVRKKYIRDKVKLEY